MEGKASDINGWEYLVVIHIISFYVVVGDGNGVGMLDLIQIVTNPLPIHYCIFSTTYSITIYIVIISNKKLQNIGNYLK